MILFAFSICIFRYVNAIFFLFFFYFYFARRIYFPRGHACNDSSIGQRGLRDSSSRYDNILNAKTFSLNILTFVLFMLLNAEINELSKFAALRQICRSKLIPRQQITITTTTTKTITTITTTTIISSLAGCKFPSIRHREIIILHACRVYRVVKKLRTKIHIHRGDWLIARRSPTPVRDLGVYGVSGHKPFNFRGGP